MLDIVHLTASFFSGSQNLIKLKVKWRAIRHNVTRGLAATKWPVRWVGQQPRAQLSNEWPEIPSNGPRIKTRVGYAGRRRPQPLPQSSRSLMTVMTKSSNNNNNSNLARTTMRIRPIMRMIRANTWTHDAAEKLYKLLESPAKKERMFSRKWNHFGHNFCCLYRIIVRVNQGRGRQGGRGEAARSEQPPHRGQLLLMIHNFM